MLRESYESYNQPEPDEIRENSTSLKAFSDRVSFAEPQIEVS